MRAIEHGLRFGEHGLPLMGSGDWNDGMNLVGTQGKGESVWLGFFLYDVLTQFAALARARRRRAVRRALRRARPRRLRGNIEQHGWDGDWYRRAYFDDGTPLGSASNAECQIDSIAQSWSVLSGAGDPRARARWRWTRCRPAPGAPRRRADPAARSAVRQVARSIPATSRATCPGVRENGGQYTHAAIWAAMAFAALGDSRARLGAVRR